MQLVNNPLNFNEFISVQQVKRLKACELGLMGGTRIAEEAHTATTNFVADMLLGQNKANEMVKRITQDHGKSFYRYEYETCKSKGPRHNDKFTDPDGQLEGTADGKWVTEHADPVCEHAHKKGGACDCEKVKEYLIVAFWIYNEADDTIKMHR